MKKYISVFFCLSFCVALMTGQAIAVPIEYSITGTASYWAEGSDPVILNESIQGSFILSDPVNVCPTCDNGHINFSLNDLYIEGEGIELSGSGYMHILYPADMFGVWGSGEPEIFLDLSGYTAREGASADATAGWDYQSFFYNEDGSCDLSFADDPYRISFYGALYGLPQNGDRYTLSVDAVKSVSVPEPSSLLLLGAGLISLFGYLKKW